MIAIAEHQCRGAPGRGCELRVSQVGHNCLSKALDTPVLSVDPAIPDQEPATQDLTTAPGSADRCTNCGAALASDQRYCVECGERRGKARFSFEALTAPAAPPPPPTRRRWQPSASFSFIGGVATLLLALGIGVLIGHGSAPQKTAAAAPNQVIKVEGLGGGTNTNTTASSTTPAKGFSATKIPHFTPKVVKKINSGAASILGGSAVSHLSSNPTQQVGQKCSGGAGCQGGKFTGNFFPGQ